MMLFWLLVFIVGIAWALSGVFMLRTHTLLGKPKNKNRQ